MEFTGERYVPAVEGQIKYEHLHRYALSLAFVAGKSVMDIASGEGYGAALLASAAKSVTGVDIDLESIEHARRTYPGPNLNFVVGSCHSVPLPDASFDVVTSFETIEHHDKHEEMLSEIKRVLKPGGVLIISSPNRLTYSDEPGYTNPFHVKELYYREFDELLRRQFKYLRAFGQRLATGSFVFPLEDSGSPALTPWTGTADLVAQKVCSLPSPIYFIAVCSDSREIEDQQINSVYLDAANDLLDLFEREKKQQIEQMQQQVGRTEEEMAKARVGYQTEIRRLLANLRQQDEVIRGLRAQLATTNQWLSEARAQIATHAEALESLYESSAWRLDPKFRQIEQWNDRWHQFEQRIRRLPSQEVFQGVLDYPRAEKVLSLAVEIYGWVYSRAAPVRLVQAFLDETYLGIVRYGMERPDVVAAFPAEATLECGYKECFWLNVLEITGDRVLKIVVCDEKGNKQFYTRTVIIQQPASSTVSASSNALSQTAPRPVAGPHVTGLARQMGNEIAEFQHRIARDPVLLDWESGLDLASAFPHLAVCSPPAGTGENPILPYLDRSFDIVAISSSQPKRIAEARRVAGVAVVSRDDGALSVEWTVDPIDEGALTTVSIVIPVYNNVSYTQNCLDQLIRTLPHNFRGEIIVVDDASSDETPKVLEQWVQNDSRIRVLRNSQNAGFINSCNRGAVAATGEVLVFLNNDTLPSPGWLPPLLQILRARPDAGAVGGKLIYPDGTLQEAGGVIFSDGSGCNFGKFDAAANAPLYNFVREVDYCSGALLATRRSLFAEIGGFDTRFIPAYYEDTDYCFTLREKGYRVYYQPETVIVHFEGASSGTDIQSGVKSYQAVNRTKFVEKWSQALKLQPHPPDRYDPATLQALSIRGTRKNGHGN